MTPRHADSDNTAREKPEGKDQEFYLQAERELQEALDKKTPDQETPSVVLPNGASTKEIPNLCAPSRRQAPLVRLKLGAPPPIRIAERLRPSTALWLVN